MEEIVSILMRRDNMTREDAIDLFLQTEEEIQRGIREAKDEREYDSLSDSAYLRAKEDYLIRNKFFEVINNYLWKKSC